MQAAFSLTPRFSEVNGGREERFNRFSGFSGLHEPAVLRPFDMEMFMCYVGDTTLLRMLRSIRRRDASSARMSFKYATAT